MSKKATKKVGSGKRAASWSGIGIADPDVKPRGTTVKKIREAVAEARKRA